MRARAQWIIAFLDWSLTASFMAETTEQKKATPTAEKPTGKPTAKPAGKATVLAERYRVLADQKVSGFSTDSVHACKVADTVGTTKAFALMCEPNLPWRAREFEFLQRKPCQGLLPILASGIVSDSQGQERFAIVYRHPDRPALVPRGKAVKPIPARTVVRVVLPQMVALLAALAERAVIHRAIRADNLFAEDANFRGLTLGDCVMSPAGMDQPSVYEPLERVLAPREGRGEGTEAADLYALGVTLLALVLGKTPGSDQDPNALLRARMSIGSFRALTGDNMAEAGGFSTVLRGLLCDQPEERWSLPTLATWIVESEKAARPKTANRSVHNPFQFENVAYDHPLLLADALARSPMAAMKVMAGPGLEPWVRNTLRDEKAAAELARLRDMVSAAKGKKESANLEESEILALLCRALDPTGPVRFRGVVAMADALGPYIAGIMAKQDHTTQDDLKTLLASGFINALCANGMAEETHDKRSLALLDKAQRWAKSDAMGLGLERCLYGFNTGLSCQSPVFAGKYVLSLKGLVNRLEKVAQEKGVDVELIDRHVAGFVASRTPRVVSQLAALSDAKSTKAARDVAAVQVLAMLQKIGSHGPLKGLAAWSHHRLKRVIEEFNSATRRKQVSEALGKATDKGDLGLMVRTIGFPASALKDEEQQQSAVRIYARLKKRVSDLRNGAEKRQKTAMARSLRLAFLASYATLICSMAYLAVVYLRMFA